jgi:drug/metabolite transporter (DMT)-like permease
MLLLLYLGLGCSALAFALWAYGLRHLTAAQNAVIGALELPVGLAAAALLLGEILSPTQLAGAALLLTGALWAVDRGVPASAAHRGSCRERWSVFRGRSSEPALQRE